MSELSNEPESLVLPITIKRLEHLAQEAAFAAIEECLATAYDGPIEMQHKQERVLAQRAVALAFEKVGKTLAAKALESALDMAGIDPTEYDIGTDDELVRYGGLQLELRVMSGGVRTDVKKLRTQLVRAGVDASIINAAFTAAQGDETKRKSFSIKN